MMKLSMEISIFELEYPKEILHLLKDFGLKKAKLPEFIANIIFLSKLLKLFSSSFG